MRDGIRDHQGEEHLMRDAIRDHQRSSEVIRGSSAALQRVRGGGQARDP
jgi:hypothetical protein